MTVPRSVVNWFPERENHGCGYCKSSSGSISYGMWAEVLDVEDYQSLIDRGWRRSGKYCYKPILHETCCPLYSIRCDAVELSLTKSQKKVIKKMNRFLNEGLPNQKSDVGETSQNELEIHSEENNMDIFYKERPNVSVNFAKCRIPSDVDMEVNNVKVSAATTVIQSSSNVISTNSEEASIAQETNHSSKQGIVKMGLGADPDKPLCKKSKLLRMEKKKNKMANSIVNSMKKPPNNKGKSLEQLLGEISPNCKHKLTVKLVQPTDPHSGWDNYKDVEFDLYRKYQMLIHDDPPEKNKIDGFVRFLVETPLQGTRFERTEDGPGYGSFHQQYWLEGTLIAVGVIDILPKCVSAVYFFYDPDFRELTLGTYGSLRELQLTREICSKVPTIRHYYMGYYIHSCLKMKYKGKLVPSYLLCPETYEWFPIEKCIIKLDEKKYARFNDRPKATDQNVCTPQHIDNVRIYYKERLIPFRSFKKLRQKQDVFNNIGLLIGRKCIDKLLFIES